MHLQAFVLLVTGLTLLASPVEKRSISEATFRDLDTFMKYASSAYSANCPKPLGNTLVTMVPVVHHSSDTQGFLARDDKKKLLVVAFRGSQQLQDWILTDANLVLVPYVSPGVSAPSGALIHAGFLAAYNSIAETVISAVRAQLIGPAAGYQLRTTGHSLGGALSSLSAVSLKSNFPNTPIQMYTYGQPRTGNADYAKLVNNLFGPNVFRTVHTADGVPTILPRELGYRHHGTEYWQNPDPASAGTVTRCAKDGEDPACSDSILVSTGINPPHFIYFNRPSTSSFCV